MGRAGAATAPEAPARTRRSLDRAPQAPDRARQAPGRTLRAADSARRAADSAPLAADSARRAADWARAMAGEEQAGGFHDLGRARLAWGWGASGITAPVQSKALLGAPASSRMTRIISAGSNGLVR